MNRKDFFKATIGGITGMIAAATVKGSDVRSKRGIKSIGFPPPPKHLMMHDPNQIIGRTGRITEVSETTGGIGYTIEYDKSLTIPGILWDGDVIGFHEGVPMFREG